VAGVVTIDVVPGSERTPAQLAEFGRYAAACNADPQQFVGYVGTEPDDVVSELTELDGDHVFAVARANGQPCGLLCAEWDLDIGRAWLYGPWAGTAELMDRLYATVRPLVPAGAAQHELFCDVANVGVAAFAERHGFAHQSAQYMMRFARARLAELAPVTLPPLTPDLHEQFAALHDRVFPGTYAPADVLLAEQPPMLVVAEDGKLLGYAALKLRPEFGDAQIKYLAVDESARGAGVGTRLLSAALHVAFADERFEAMDLMTNSAAARRLYERVGFTLLREMRSFRNR
jgi:ribosomal protein S18 acetylase RimI-like enzyme